jgi:hypothetical protein
MKAKRKRPPKSSPSSTGARARAPSNQAIWTAIESLRGVLENALAETGRRLDAATAEAARRADATDARLDAIAAGQTTHREAQVRLEEQVRALVEENARQRTVIEDLKAWRWRSAAIASAAGGAVAIGAQALGGG